MKTALGISPSPPFKRIKNGLIDLFGGNVSAFSLRLLRKDYKGGLIRVRRSSDNAEKDIFCQSNRDLDTKTLLDFVGVGNNGFVTKWYNQTGVSTFDFSQTTAAKQPTIVESGSLVVSNGMIAINMDGLNGDGYMINGGLIGDPSNNDMTIFMVQEHGITADGGYALVETRAVGSYGSNVIMGGTAGESIFSVINPSSNVGANTTGTILFGFVYDGSDCYAYRDGLLNEGPRAVALSTSLLTTVIGGFGDETSTTGFNAKVQELVAWKSDKRSDVATIMANINSYWSIY